MDQVGQLATKRVVTAPPQTSVVQLARIMREEHVGDVIIVEDDSNKPTGIVTDRDLVVGVMAQDPDDLTRLLAQDVCLAPLYTCFADESVEAVVERMSIEGIRRLPVVDVEGQLVGIVTFDDLMRHLLATASRLIEVASVQRHVERYLRQV